MKVQEQKENFKHFRLSQDVTTSSEKRQDPNRIPDALRMVVTSELVNLKICGFGERGKEIKTWKQRLPSLYILEDPPQKKGVCYFRKRMEVISKSLKP